MRFTGGTLNRSQTEAAMRKRTELQAHLRDMEVKYQRHLWARTAHHPDAKYLKQCINDLRRELGVK